MVAEETHSQPGSSAPPRKFALSSVSVSAHGSCAARRPSALQPSLPAWRSVPRGRRARRSPRAGGAAPASAPPPGPAAGARGPPRPRPPRALPRPPRPPARPQASARPGPVALAALSLSRAPPVLSFSHWTRNGTKSEESGSRGWSSAHPRGARNVRPLGLFLDP